MDLNARLEEAQRTRNQDWRALAVRIERAQAGLNRRACEAARGAVLEVRGGLAVFAGLGNPLTQALCMGFEGPLSDAELDSVEAHLGRGAGPVQYELCPMASPELFAALGARGYRVQELQLCWQRPLDSAPVLEIPAGLELRAVTAAEAPSVQRVLMAGFMDVEPEAVTDAQLRTMPALPPGDRLVVYGAFRGAELIGGATLFVEDGVATLAGTAVLPRHRGRGAQGALIRVRLAEAHRRGCTLAATGTAPGSASQRNMERHGFRVAYPKVVLVKG